MISPSDADFYVRTAGTDDAFDGPGAGSRISLLVVQAPIEAAQLVAPHQ